jgi:hypothetical protein
VIFLGKPDSALVFEFEAAKVGFDPNPAVVLKSSFVCEDPDGWPAIVIEPLPPMDPEMLTLLRFAEKVSKEWHLDPRPELNWIKVEK